MSVYRGAIAVLAITFVGDRRRAAGGHGRPRRRRARVRARRPLHRARRRPADTAPQGRAVMARKLRGFQRVLDAPALFSVAYGEIASSIYFALGIVAALRARLHAARAPRRRDLLPDRLALLRRGHGGAARDRRRGDLRPPRVQRRFRLPHRLGAVPRLPDRDRALDAVPAALPGHGARDRGAPRVAVGHRRRRRRHPRDRRRPARRAAPSCTRRARGRRARPRDAAPARDPRARSALLAGRAHAGDRSSASRRPGTTSPSRCRSRCSPTPASRPSPTSPRRRASRAGHCRAASSPRSGSSS